MTSLSHPCRKQKAKYRNKASHPVISNLIVMREKLNYSMHPKSGALRHEAVFPKLFTIHTMPLSLFTITTYFSFFTFHLSQPSSPFSNKIIAKQCFQNFSLFTIHSPLIQKPKQPKRDFTAISHL